jgi:HK97 family phage prohead protease
MKPPTDTEHTSDSSTSIRGPEAFRREITPIVEPIAGSAPIIDFTSSDQSLDRYDEIIVASGWRLDNYRKNPVVQNAHQYGDILFTIGKATLTEIRNLPHGPALYQRIEFATDVNPMARIAYGLYKGRFLNAVSVGFLPLRWEDGTEKSDYSRKFLEQELLEVSAVGIPANPNALQLALKHGAVRQSDVRELAQLLATLTRETPLRHADRELSDTLAAIRSIIRVLNPLARK